MDLALRFLFVIIVGRTYYFRVNGEPVFLKGSNWIPSAVLPELITEQYLRELLTASKDAHMNAMRIWGGGIYEFPEFYRVLSFIKMDVPLHPFLLLHLSFYSSSRVLSRLPMNWEF